MDDFTKLEEKLNIQFDNKELLAQAFCHRSYLNEHPDFKRGNNERLEFLGDAVLELIVSDYLFKEYPKEEEGMMTSLRAALVNTKMLAQVAEEADFDQFLLLSKGEKKELGKARQDILADTCEALIGALYLDQGYGACEKLIKNRILVKLPSILDGQKFVDDKSHFQEIAQEKEKFTPRYEIIKSWGPDHAKHFVSGVFLGDELIAKGEGMSKQESEESAARAGLKARAWND